MSHPDAEGPRFELTPETWPQVRELLAAALERSPEDRATFLDNACGSARALRLGVESLLHAHVQSDGFLTALSAREAVQLFADLEPPVLERTLGPYRIAHEMGAVAWAWCTSHTTPSRSPRRVEGAAAVSQ